MDDPLVFCLYKTLSLCYSKLSEDTWMGRRIMPRTVDELFAQLPPCNAEAVRIHADEVRLLLGSGAEIRGSCSLNHVLQNVTVIYKEKLFHWERLPEDTLTRDELRHYVGGR